MSQFHYGSIKTVMKSIKDLISTVSQFHYGSIKTNWPGSTLEEWEKSQFHYGSIKTNNNYNNEVVYKKSLNSTMVRLKPT